MKSMVSRVPKARHSIQVAKHSENQAKASISERARRGDGEEGAEQVEAKISCTSTDSKEFETDQVREEFQ